jgi:hypothetical protein
MGLRYGDKAVLGSVLSLVEAWEEWGFGYRRSALGFGHDDMNGDRGSEVSFDLKRWSLNLFCC